VPWILEVRDLWPDFPVQMGAIPSVPLRRALYRLEQWLYQDAHHVVAVSPDMARHVRSHLAPTHAHSRGRVSTLLPGTDQHLLAHAMERSPETLRQHHGIEARNVVLYAGTFGRANDLPTLLDAARRFRERDIAFLFVGHGYYEPAVRRAADRLSHVFVLPPQPHHRMLSWFALADLALVSFIDLPVLATNAPAKFFDSLSAGTPVIVTNPGWTKSFVEKHRCGWYVPASRPALLADQIATLVSNKARLQAAGDRGARIAQRRFARSDYAEGVTALLESAAEGRS
jgi:glycosyltransferase involved in cell wall biosynthesis